MNNNKGFSYVEMLIVLAILAIMIGITSISISTVNQNSALRATEKIESLVNRARVSALTKGSDYGYANIVKIGNKVYGSVGKRATSAEEIKQNGELICSGNLDVYLASAKLTEKSLRYVRFKQSTGGLVSDDINISVYVKAPKYKSRGFIIQGLTGNIDWM